MSTRSAEYREAVEHLPAGSVLVLQDVPWEAYEQLLEDLSDRPGVRVTYDEGSVELVTPLRKHEKYKELVGDLIKAVGDELEINVESSGSTTWKKQKDAKGLEADVCFHITHAEQVIGRDSLDLNVDPPPDLAIEIDITNESASKFPIYATFRVPEVWRYSDKRKSVVMYELRDRAYVEIEASRSLPVLTPEIVTRFIEQSQIEGRRKALDAFRRWIRSR